MSEIEIGARYTLCVCDHCGSIREGFDVPEACPHCGHKPEPRVATVTAVDRENGTITIAVQK